MPSTILVVGPNEPAANPVPVFQRTTGNRATQTKSRKIPCTRFQCIIIWTLISFVLIMAFAFLGISALVYFSKK